MFVYIVYRQGKYFSIAHCARSMWSAIAVIMSSVCLSFHLSVCPWRSVLWRSWINQSINQSIKQSVNQNFLTWLK